MTAPRLIPLSTRGRPARELLGIYGGLGTQPGVPALTGRLSPESITILGDHGVETVLVAHGPESVDLDLPRVAYDVTLYRYARLVAEVATAGAAASALTLQYRAVGSGGAWADAGASDPVTASLQTAGLVVGAGVLLATDCTGDCEFRVIASGGDDSRSPALRNLYVQFLPAPADAATDPEDPDSGGDSGGGGVPGVCNSTLSGNALYAEDYCPYVSMAEMDAAYGSGLSLDGGRTRVRRRPASSGFDFTQFVTDSAYNGGHHGLRLTLPASSTLERILRGWTLDDLTGNANRYTDLWVRSVFAIPAAYADSDTEDFNSLYLSRIYSATGGGATLWISRWDQSRPAAEGGAEDAGPLALYHTTSVINYTTSETEATHASAGTVASVFSHDGPSELVIHAVGDGADFTIDYWLGPARTAGGALAHLLTATGTIHAGAVVPTFGITEAELFYGRWFSASGTPHELEHLEFEYAVAGGDPFNVDG